MKKAIRFTPEDTVAVALEGLFPGASLEIGGEKRPYTVKEAIPEGHKVADRNILKGEPVIKYGHVIGTAVCDIPEGSYVHIHNVRDSVADWSGKLTDYNPATVTEISEDLRLSELPKLTGYRRKNGMVGFRNHLLVLSTTVCANQPVEMLGAKYPEIVCVTNPSGCVILPNEVERLKAILLGLSRNPNVGAVVFVGLGCESVESQWFYEEMKEEKPAAYIRCQSEGSTAAAYEELERIALNMLENLRKEKRQEASVADIRLGSKCGASDWTTAAASNPAIGYCSDLVVKNGGISIIGETTGWFGGEEILVHQARSRKIAEDILELMQDIYQRALAVGRRIEEGNPTPGNHSGGITTLTEKALGNVKKGGTAPIEGVLRVGEAPGTPGFYVSDNPGLDPISLLTLTCSSANVLLYSTGRGTPVGTPVAPAIKLTGCSAITMMWILQESSGEK